MIMIIITGKGTADFQKNVLVDRAIAYLPINWRPNLSKSFETMYLKGGWNMPSSEIFKVNSYFIKKTLIAFITNKLFVQILNSMSILLLYSFG